MKKTYIILGLIALAAIAFYLYKRKKAEPAPSELPVVYDTTEIKESNISGGNPGHAKKEDMAPVFGPVKQLFSF